MQSDSIEIIEEREKQIDSLDKAIFAEIEDNMQYQKWLRPIAILLMFATNSLILVICDIRPDILAKQIAIGLKS